MVTESVTDGHNKVLAMSLGDNTVVDVVDVFVD